MKKIIVILLLGQTLLLCAQQANTRLYGMPVDTVIARYVAMEQSILTYDKGEIIHIIFTSPDPDFLKIGYNFTNGLCTSIEYYFSTKYTKRMQCQMNETYVKAGSMKWKGEDESITIKQTPASTGLSYLEIVSRK